MSDDDPVDPTTLDLTAHWKAPVADVCEHCGVETAVKASDGALYPVNPEHKPDCPRRAAPVSSQEKPK